MRNRIAIPVVLAAVLAASCHGRSQSLQREQQNYDVVQEGQASGVSSTINAPGETPPPATNTNADTTSNFTLAPNVDTSGTAPAGTIAGTLPTTTGVAMPATPHPIAPPPGTPRVITPAPQPRPLPQVQPRREPPPPPEATDTITTTIPPTDTTATQQPPQDQKKKDKEKDKNKDQEQPPPPQDQQQEQQPPPPPPPTQTDTRGM